jgi:hypothetical protein
MQRIIRIIYDTEIKEKSETIEKTNSNKII